MSGCCGVCVPVCRQEHCSSRRHEPPPRIFGSYLCSWTFIRDTGRCLPPGTKLSHLDTVPRSSAARYRCARDRKSFLSSNSVSNTWRTRCFVSCAQAFPVKVGVQGCVRDAVTPNQTTLHLRSAPLNDLPATCVPKWKESAREGDLPTTFKDPFVRE